MKAEGATEREQRRQCAWPLSCERKKWRQFASECPQLVEADISPKMGDSRFDPQETWAAQGFRSAKGLFVFRLKRDIVPSVAWA
jgi:hypothetical protein